MIKPPPVHTHRRDITAIIGVVSLLLAVCWFYYFVDPVSGLMPRCLFKLVTGYDCPGCGFQRALHALLHGEIAKAWHFNAFAFFAVPAGAFYVVLDFCRGRMPGVHKKANHPLLPAVVLASVLGWWIIRNL